MDSGVIQQVLPGTHSNGVLDNHQETVHHDLLLGDSGQIGSSLWKEPR